MAAKKFTIRQSTGKNLEEVIAGILVKSPVVVLKELVSNSYDADSENVVVEIDEKKKTIFVGDDGSGMDEKGLETFKQMGDSIKVANPISPKGRKRIGKFGIAKVLLRYLGTSYQIDTWCNGEHISGREDFQKKQGLVYVVEKDKSKKIGTSILVENSKFVGTDLLSVQKLRHALIWEIPNQKDFIVRLNKEKLVRKNTKPTQIFSFKETLPIVGEVDMESQYFVNPPKIHGIYLYVNERSVGKGDAIDMKKISRSLAGRIFVTIHADGLQKHIAFNREYIKEDNEAYAEVKKWVYENLRKIRKATASFQPAKKKLKAAPQIKKRVRQALGEFRPFGKKDDSELGNKQRGKVEDYSDFYRKLALINISEKATSESSDRLIDVPKPEAEIQFSRTYIVERGAFEAQSQIDPRTQELLINADHPWYKSIETTNSDVLRMHILLGTAFAVSLDKWIREFRGSKEQMKKFNSLCTELLGTEEAIRKIGSIKSQAEQGIFVPFRRYNVSEIVREHMSLACLKELVDAGILNVHNNTILGSELNEYMNKAMNYTPAIELVKSYAQTIYNPKTRKVITREGIRQKYGAINPALKRFKNLIPFVYDVGKTGPFFLVRNEKVPNFLGLYSQGAIKKGANWETHMEKYGSLFEKLCKIDEKSGEKFVGLEMLCDVSASGPHEIFKIISFAQKRGLKLTPIRENDVVKYPLSEFRKAREQYFLGGENAH